MPAHPSRHAPADARNRRICIAALAAPLFGHAAVAACADLVDHNGFEACWSQAVTETTFVANISASVEGYAGCIPAVSSGNPTYCNNSVCNSVPGCPIVLRAGSAAVHSIDAGAGVATFDVTSGLDPFSMDVTINGVTCTANITNTGNLTSSYTLSYAIYPDGNSGIYVDALSAIGSISTSGLLASDYNVTGGSFTCSIAGVVPAGLIEGAINAGVDNSVPGAEAPTIGDSICPYTPQ